MKSNPWLTSAYSRQTNVSSVILRPEFKEKAAGLADTDRWWWLLLLLHIPLALLLSQVRSLATAHALAVVGLGVVILALDRNRERAVRWSLLLVAYVVGAEVLWRMTKAGVFWEYGKYAAILLLGLALLRYQGRNLRLHPLPLLYLALLVPALAFWAGDDLGRMRDQVSFNLSGPLCLAVAVLFFANYQVNAATLRRLLLMVIAPTISIATVALYTLWTTPAVRFTTEGNFAASGGFGPNQVSAALSLGAVACWFLLINVQPRVWVRILMAALMVWFLAQIFLTFSRTGLYLTGLTIVASLPFFLLITANRKRWIGQVLVGLCAVALVIQFVVLPRLDQYTGGMLLLRFSDTDTSGRLQLGEVQLQIWLEHFISGVGPGKATVAGQAIWGHNVASHTEITRLLAEHGLFGLAALLVLGIGGLVCLWRAPSGWERSLVAACLAWTLLFFLTSAMRTAAPSFLYGLAWSIALGAGVSVGQMETESTAKAAVRGDQYAIHR
jgi:hypothetical protein